MRQKFIDHLTRYDFDKIFNIPNDFDLLQALRSCSYQIFEDYHINPKKDSETWIQLLWEQGKKYGFQFAEPASTTALGCNDIILVGYSGNDFSNSKNYLFSNKDGHWHIGRGGNGIKSILKSNNWKNELDLFLKHLKGFDPPNHESFDFYISTKWAHKYKDLSVLYHLCYPQFYPVFYTATKEGYSQVKGINLLLDEVVEAVDNNIKRKDLDLYHNYDHYSAAYRVLLFIYDEALQQNQLKTHHWDYFTQCLADIDMRADALSLLKRKKAIILYGVPGTGKTHFSKKLAEKLVIDNKTHIEIIQFHPNYSYQDFLIGIRPKSTVNGVIYPVVPGQLYCACYQAALSEDKFVIIIDEINRADLAKVFGEIMYCIEYRGSKGSVSLPNKLSDDKSIESFFDCSLPVDLPDPFKKGSKFYIPDNLYIIGTMNTVDKSVTGFDIALRRRFGWFKVEYDESELINIIEHKLIEYNEFLLKDEDFLVIENLDLFCKRATNLNKEIITKLPLTKEHVIGHTYFSEIMDILFQDEPFGKVDIKTKQLRHLWMYHLESLLEEYLGYDYLSEANQQALYKLRNDFTCKLN